MPFEMEAPKVKRKGDGFAELTYNDDYNEPVEKKEEQPQEEKPATQGKIPAEENPVEKTRDLFSEQTPEPIRERAEEKLEGVPEPSVAEVAQGAPPWVARSEEGRKPTVMQVVSKPFVRDVRETRNLIVVNALPQITPIDKSCRYIIVCLDRCFMFASKFFVALKRENSQKNSWATCSLFSF